MSVPISSELDPVALFDIKTYVFEYLIDGLVKDYSPILGRQNQVIDQYGNIMTLVYVFACIHLPIVLRRSLWGMRLGEIKK